MLSLRSQLLINRLGRPGQASQRCAIKLRVAPAGVGVATAKVTLKIPKHLEFGDSISVVGLDGSWDPMQSSTNLAWTEGDIWSGELSLPTGTNLECKYVVLRAEPPEMEWQQGDNSHVVIPAGAVAAEVNWLGEEVTVNILSEADGTMAPSAADLDAVEGSVADGARQLVTDVVATTEAVPAMVEAIMDAGAPENVAVTRPFNEALAAAAAAPASQPFLLDAGISEDSDIEAAAAAAETTSNIVESGFANQPEKPKVKAKKGAAAR